MAASLLGLLLEKAAIEFIEWIVARDIFQARKPPRRTLSDGGNIEFWPGNYAGGNAKKIPGANDKAFDFGDAPNNKIPGYGCMQVHNWKAKQVIFVLNRWGNNGILDTGIGNAPGANTDWTFSGSGKNYKTIRLTVMVK